ncbi:MAG TPA: cytochrome c biogenesis protein CcdA [Acidobacteriota bacterium]|nr:cytochrome c biogenesis protein CcdA [Acidobacteriota bacterium]
MGLDVGLFTALFAGALSFFSPCVLPIVPGYLSFITGFSFDDLTQDRRQKVVWIAFWNSIAFVIGFSLVFIALGATATTIGGFLRAHLKLLGQIAGVIIILLGIHLTGLYRFSFLLYDKRVHGQEKGRGFLGALLAGVFFGFGWTPCVGPILAGILALAAVSDTVLRGVFLLALYSIGLGIGFILAALFLNQFLAAFKKVRMHLRKIEIASGVLLLFIGALIATNHLALISQKLSFLNPEALAVSQPVSPAVGAETVALKSVNFNPGSRDFQAEYLDGSTRKLSDFRGKIVLVNFWATWCAPCRAEIPGLLNIYHQKKDQFEIIGVAEESEVNDIRAFVKDMKMDYPIALDTKGAVGGQYKIAFYPTSYLFAPDGTLVREVPGYLPEEVLRKDLAELEKKYAR